MIIPEYYAKFVKRKEIYGYLASVGENFYCDTTRTCGIYPVDQEYLKILYMSELSPGILINLQRNSLITLNVISAYTFESFQMKGKYISHENLTVEDKKYKENYLRGMIELIEEMKFGLSPKSLEKYSQLDAIAVIMKVEEIYEQTPKKGTGEKIMESNHTA